MSRPLRRASVIRPIRTVFPDYARHKKRPESRGSSRKSASRAGLSTHTQRKAHDQEGQLDRNEILCMCRTLWMKMWNREQERAKQVDRMVSICSGCAIRRGRYSCVSLYIMFRRESGDDDPPCTARREQGTVSAGNLWRWGITDGWPPATWGLITIVLLLSVPPAGGDRHSLSAGRHRPLRRSGPERGRFLLAGGAGDAIAGIRANADRGQAVRESRLGRALRLDNPLLSSKYMST